MGWFSSTMLLFFFFFFVFTSSLVNDHTSFTLKGVDIERPVLDVSPSPLSGHSATHGVKGMIRCERVQVSGISRLKHGSYANSFHVTLVPSVAIPERLHNKIQVCFHRNNTLGWCQCEKDEWRGVQKGIWSALMSPYETRYVDVRIDSEISGSVTIALEEDCAGFQQRRLICLAVGLILLLLAPIISSWVAFYYGNSMAIGIFLVIIILLFQGMKLLPTGRKNILYLTIYGSVLGAGTFLMHQFSVIINSSLQSFGMSEEMHNPVALFVLILAGAALGYWIVRRFVISEDGSVDAGVAQFVKWTMRIIGTTYIWQLGAWTFLMKVAQFVKRAMRIIGTTFIWQLGAGTFLMHQFSVIINSVLQSFGMSEEMHNPVALFVLLGIILAGAALGYWIVRRFVISKDGSVDAGVARFVKWAMRIIGTTFIWQSILDTLSIGALVFCGAVCKLFSSRNGCCPRKR